jgi:hypothetical protein
VRDIPKQRINSDTKPFINSGTPKPFMRNTEADVMTRSQRDTVVLLRDQIIPPHYKPVVAGISTQNVQQANRVVDISNNGVNSASADYAGGEPVGLANTL